MIYTRFLLTLLLLVTAFVPSRAGISLDHVVGLEAASADPFVLVDTIHCGIPIEFHLRWTSSPEQGAVDFITGSTNGFRLYDAGYGTSWTYPLGDTIMGEWNPAIDWETLYYDFPFINTFSADGMGADTIGIGGFKLNLDGIPGTFDDVFAVITIEINCSESGRQICLDSSYYRPGGFWLWSTTAGSNDTVGWDGPHCFAVGSMGVSTPSGDNGPQLPKEFALNQNYPNPFNPATTISFDVPYRSHVKISVYNTLGQVVAVPLDKLMEPGFNNRVLWDTARENVASGVYFFKMEAGDFVETRKMLLLK